MLITRSLFKMYRDEVRAAVAQAALEPLMQGGLLVQRDAQRSMKRGGRILTERTGSLGWALVRKRTGGKKKRTHWMKAEPSTPPDPPHVQTGNLRSAITTAPTAQGTVIVGPTRIAWYGKIHEKGGRHGKANYPARPFMGPALAGALARIAKLLRGLKLGKTPAGARLNSLKGHKP